MRLRNEQELLSEDIRVALLKEISGSEEKERRNFAYKAHQCYRDQTKIFVIELLLKQFQQTTVNQMQYALANISIVRKVIDKLARVYNYGIEREISESNELTEELQSLANELNSDTHMKMINKILKLQKNALLYIKPSKYLKGGEEFMTVKWMPLSPHQYSVIEDFYDRTKPMAVILSTYRNEGNYRVSQEPAKEGRTVNTPHAPAYGDRKDQAIADVAEDEDLMRYIWWSDSYHFTTNGKGQIIDPATDQAVEVLTDELVENPIEELPFVDFAIDRDGSYWARGGDDLVDGSVLINTLITNMNHIAVTQGYGQLVVKGSNLPRNFLLGPDKAVLFEYDKDSDPVPEFEYVQASPPLEELMRAIEMYVALMLTTNNLSTSGISMQLKSGAEFPSGIAMMIDKSESQEDVEEQQRAFLDGEPDAWRKTAKMIQAIKEDPNVQVDDAIAEISLPDNIDENFTMTFGTPQALVSEGERLDNLKKRKDIGIASMIDLIMMDNPMLTEEQAIEKLKKISEEALDRQKQMMDNMIVDENGEDDDENVDNPFEKKDNLDESDGDEGQ